MKTLIIFLTLGLNYFFLQHQIIEYKKNNHVIKETHLLGNQNCYEKNEENDSINIDDIRSLLRLILEKNTIQNDEKNKILNFFKKNEEISLFPSNEDDTELYYDFLDYIAINSECDFNSMELLFRLSFIIHRNAEISEYLWQLCSKSALKNPEGFIKLLSILKPDERSQAMGLLELFNKEEYNVFRKKMLKLKNKKNIDIINEILEELNSDINH
jgi:hypothetical protein